MHVSGSCGGGLVELQALFAVGPDEARPGPCRVCTLQRYAEMYVPRLLASAFGCIDRFSTRNAAVVWAINIVQVRARYWLDQFFTLMEKFPRYLSYEQRNSLISACAFGHIYLHRCVEHVI